MGSTIALARCYAGRNEDLTPWLADAVVNTDRNLRLQYLAGWAINSMNKSIKNPKNAKDKKLNELMRDYPNVPYSQLSSIKAPVLIMGGDRDVIRPEHLLKLFQSIPNSQMCIIPGATHGASWAKKDLFMTLLYDFFDKPFSMPTTEDWYKE